MQISVIICLFNKIVGCVSQVTHSIQVHITNPHHTVDKNGVYLKITTFSCIQFKIYISELFLLKISDHVMQIKSKIIKSFYA